MKKDNRYFDVIDLDPYGSCLPYLDSALALITNGGLLCLTFTDLKVLCGSEANICFYKYGTIPLGKSYCHEQALRMALFTINTVANRIGR